MDFLKHVKNSDKYALAFIALIVFFAGFQVGQNFSLLPTTKVNKDIVSSLQSKLQFDTLQEVWNVINTDYVKLENLNSTLASYGLAKGLVESLDDPYSVFLTPDETKVFNSDLNQELDGIGAEITEEDGIIKVVSPIKGSPAEKAGLKPNDIILSVNEEEITGLNVYEAIQKIRGKSGTTVSLLIYREGIKDPFEVKIVRDKIAFESVTTEVLPNNFFYISINQFSDDTTKEFFKATSAALLQSPEGIILDLRYNGGGYLETAVDILGEFLPKGSPAVVVEMGASKLQETDKTNGTSRLQGVPLVVLINEGSASASEILAGALKDNNKAYLIGKTSYGKGTVQEIVEFKDGSSLRLSIAKWYTPLGNDIDKVGITPDLEVENNSEKTDLQLEAAKNYLLKSNI